MNNSTDRKNKVHLVLSSGGMRCLSYAGALSVMAEHAVEFADVSACSAGALVGALLCAGLSPDEIAYEILEKIDFMQLEGSRKIRWKLFEILSYRKYPFARFEQLNVAELFNNILSRYPELNADPTFAELKIPFSTAGIDLASKKFLVYSRQSTPDMKVGDALKIALAAPFMTPPHRQRGRIVVDAAVASECPVWMVADYEQNFSADELDEIPIVALKPKKSPVLDVPKNAGEYVASIVDAGVSSRDEYLINQLPRVRMIEINCDGVKAEDFDLSGDKKDFLIKSGRDAVREAMRIYGEDFRQMPIKITPEIKSADTSDRAEQEAEKLMKNFSRKLPSLLRNSVFISYAHEDANWMEKFREQLQPYIDRGMFNVWTDREIKPGDKWDESIKQALDSTKVALLLVTPKFLNSKYILNEELRYFLKASKDNGLIIFWVMVEDVGYEVTELAPYQAANSDLAKALNDYEKNFIDNEIVAICRKIMTAVKPSIDES